MERFSRTLGEMVRNHIDICNYIGDGLSFKPGSVSAYKSTEGLRTKFAILKGALNGIS